MYILKIIHLYFFHKTFQIILETKFVLVLLKAKSKSQHIGIEIYGNSIFFCYQLHFFCKYFFFFVDVYYNLKKVQGIYVLAEKSFLWQKQH